MYAHVCLIDVVNFSNLTSRAASPLEENERKIILV